MMRGINQYDPPSDQDDKDDPMEDPTGQSQDVGLIELFCDEESPAHSFHESPPRAPKKVAHKRPRMFSCLNDFGHDEAEGVPDLHDYFQQYNLNNADTIRICRSYANYLASQRRQRGPVRKL